MLLCGSALGAAATWVGNTDANWATTANWSGNQPTGNTPNFGAPGSSGTTLNNNLPAGTTIVGITFTTGVTGGYTIGGAAISLTGNITGATPSTTVTGTHTINLDMDIGSTTRTITTAGGSSYMSITLGGVIGGSGSAGLTKAYSSGANNTVVTLTGLNTFPGKVSASGTPLVINTIADSGVACSLGYNSIFTLGLVTTADGTLRYVGGPANSNRQLEIGNTTTSNNRGGRIENQGTGPLTFTAATFNAIPVAGITVARTLTLSSTYSGSSSEIQGVIQDHDTAGGGLVNLTVGASGVSGGAWKLSGANSYSGATTITEGGILEATTLANGGSNSSIGKSGNAAANLVFGYTASGTLRYVGSANATTDRAFTYPNSSYTAFIESSGAGTLTFDTPANAPAFYSTTASAKLSLGGSNTGANTFSKNLTNNPADNTKPLALTKTGAGLWILSGANSYSGITLLTGGALDVGTNAGNLSSSSYLHLDGGVLQANGSFTRANSTTIAGGNFRWLVGAGGGFSARGGKLVVTINNSAATEQNWTTAVGGNNNIVGTLMFGSPSANSEVEFSNGINLNSVNDSPGVMRTIDVTAGTGADFATLSGIVRITGTGTSTGGIVKQGAGTLKLTNANTYNGGTAVNAGTLLVDNTTGSGTGTGTVTVNAGGYVGGDGTIGSNLVMANGGFAAQIGKVLDVSGNLDLSSASDRLVILGTQPTAPVVVLRYTGTRTGTFNNLPKNIGVNYDDTNKEVAIMFAPPGTVVLIR
jgi:fibronectin-binding autotransporter adhesin